VEMSHFYDLLLFKFNVSCNAYEDPHRAYSGIGGNEIHARIDPPSFVLVNNSMLVVVR